MSHLVNLEKSIMMFKKDEAITLIGGSGAVANNISQFCKDVTLISYLGSLIIMKNLLIKI